ncbi:MAG TPA: aminotransferase [Clostridiaceae bacterium]|nr:aminotransferase [Clostridiaceae bacterium]
MKQVKVYIETTKNNLPQSGSSGAAGWDLIAAQDCIILPGQTKLIDTGIKTAISAGYEIQIRPRSGISLRTALRIPNSPGTIDSDYRDEIKVIAHNTFQITDLPNLILFNPVIVERLKEFHMVDGLTYFENNNLNTGLVDLLSEKLKKQLKKTAVYLDQSGYPFGTIKIKKGERFAQMVVAKYCMPQFEIVRDITSIGTDRGGGFGSTGKD